MSAMGDESADMPVHTFSIATVERDGPDGIRTRYYPACTCGKPANGTWDTREGAERSGRAHQCSHTPPRPGRYSLTLDEDGTIRLRCEDCDTEVVAWTAGSFRDETGAVLEVEFAREVRSHDEQAHPAEGCNDG